MHCIQNLRKNHSIPKVAGIAGKTTLNICVILISGGQYSFPVNSTGSVFISVAVFGMFGTLLKKSCESLICFKFAVAVVLPRLLKGFAPHRICLKLVVPVSQCFPQRFLPG